MDLIWIFCCESAQHHIKRNCDLPLLVVSSLLNFIRIPVLLLFLCNSIAWLDIPFSSSHLYFYNSSSFSKENTLLAFVSCHSIADICQYFLLLPSRLFLQRRYVPWISWNRGITLHWWLELLFVYSWNWYPTKRWNWRYHECCSIQR